MAKVSFREPLLADVAAIAPRMREIDKVECGVNGRSPEEALRLGMDASLLCWTGCVDGEAEAMFGVTPLSLLTGWGRPWLLGTERARRQQRSFLTLAPAYLQRMEALLPRLDNYVSARNRAAIRWLRYLGFVVETEATAFNGEPMLYFHKGF